MYGDKSKQVKYFFFSQQLLGFINITKELLSKQVELKTKAINKSSESLIEYVQASNCETCKAFSPEKECRWIFVQLASIGFYKQQKELHENGSIRFEMKYDVIVYPPTFSQIQDDFA